VPLDWAATQHGLGIALLALGVRESGAERLEEAVRAFRDALTVPGESKPDQGAEIRWNLSAALHLLKQGKGGS
jgi:hypothetical protein